MTSNTNLGRVALAIVLLYILFVLFFDPDASPLYVGGGHSNYRRAACQSNMKQLGLALVQYSQDYDDTLPRAATVNGYGWREATFPYVKSTECYHCPDDKRSSQRPDNLPKSYAANDAVLGGSVALAAPNTISAVDTRGYDGEDWNMTGPAFLPSTGRELYAHVPRHLFYEHPSGMVNCLFIDGHVRAKKPADTLAPVNLWARDNAPFVGQDLANARAILTHAEEE